MELEKNEMKIIDYNTAVEFLLPRHYSGRIPSITYAFGWYFENKLMAVCTFGKPVSNSLCWGICGKEESKNVYELNRMCREDDFKEPLSKFLGWCLRYLSQYNLIIVSYSDTEMNHHGYVYQATNFIYTGKTKKRTDKYTEGNKHSRHYSNENQGKFRKVRSPKHRYVFFAVNSKKKKKELLEKLNYPILKYPKGDNINYKLGEYLKPTLIENS